MLSLKTRNLWIIIKRSDLNHCLCLVTPNLLWILTSNERNCIQIVYSYGLSCRDRKTSRFNGAHPQALLQYEALQLADQINQPEVFSLMVNLITQQYDRLHRHGNLFSTVNLLQSRWIDERVWNHRPLSNQWFRGARYADLARVSEEGGRDW